MVALTLLLLLTPQESLEDLLRRLDDGEIAEREEAVRRLMGRELADLPALEKAWADSGDAERRARLARAIAGVRRKRHAELFRELAASREAGEQEAGAALGALDARGALRALAKRGGGLVDRTVHALLDLFREDGEVVREVLRAKPLSWPPSFAAHAARHVDDADPQVCRSALAALSRLRRDREALPGVDGRDLAARVAAMAGREDHPCREAALEALPLLGDERSVEAIFPALRAAGAELQILGLTVLRAYLERRPGLAERARDAEPLLGSPSLDVRRLAYEALAVHPRPEADLPRVREALRAEDPRARWGAIELAAALEDASLAPEVARLLPEKDGAKAAEALFRLGPAVAAGHLAACLERQSGLTEAWIRHLARHAPPETLEPFRRGLIPILERGGKEARSSALGLAPTLDAWFDAETVAVAEWENAIDPTLALARVSSARTARGIEFLRAALRHEDEWMRREAIQAAGRAQALGALDDLLAALDADRQNRDEVIRTLGRLGDRRALPRLLRYADSNRHAREAIELLGRPEDAAGLLEKAREIDDPAARRELVGAAARLLGERAPEALRPRIDDRRLRGAALEALAARGAPECAPEAAKHLSDSDPAAVRAAVRILGQARRVESVPRLLELLAERDVRDAAAEALARMPREAVAPGVALHLRSRDPSLRQLAARILLDLDADELAGALKELLGDDSPGVARAGVAMVRRRKFPEHLDEVERLSRHSDERLRREALAALAELDWAGRREILLRRLEEALPDIAPLFGARGDDAALPILLRRAAEEGAAGYEALVALNSYRTPAAFTRATEPSLAGISSGGSASLEEKARKLSHDAGVPIRVEIPPPPPPRASFEDAFGSDRFRSSVGFRGGSMMARSGRYSLLEKLRAALGETVVPILEEDSVRLVPRAKAPTFWTAWAESRRR